MRRLPKTNVLLDRLHKGFVVTCIGVTAVATLYLSYSAYNYFAVYKPTAKQKQLVEKQQLLLEGSSDNLQDTAPSLQI